METKNRIISEKLKNLPTSSGVYLMRDIDGNIIYVGKAKNLKNRVSQYFLKKNTRSSGYSFKVKAMVDKIYDFDYLLTLSEVDALALENNLIKKHQPFYNILLKDGKAFTYIKVTVREKFPRVLVVRKVINDGSKYFGPYIAGVNAYQLLDIITNAFQIRTCKLKISDKKAKRECLNYSLGLCSAPCTHRISEKEYGKIIEKVIDFLSGNDKEVEKVLQAKMKKEAGVENFEKALECREQINALKKMQERAVAEVPKTEAIDVFAYATNGFSGAICMLIVRSGKILGVQNITTIDASIDESEILSSYITQYYEYATPPKLILTSHECENLGEFLSRGIHSVETRTAQKGYKKKLIDMAINNAEEHLSRANTKEKNKYETTMGALEKLQEKLGLSRLPRRIECYDISNTQGTNSVASMVVFLNGEKVSKHYRKFKIKTIDGPNDFESLKEVLSRRLEKIDVSEDQSFSSKPDLIVIDGGKGQLSVMSETLFERRSDIDIISLAEKFDEVFKPSCSTPIMLKRGSVELRLLQNIRDEAHRFAITFHKNLRQKSMLKSPLDNIKGVGKVKKNALIRQFKTIDAIRQARPDEIALVKGIDKVLALEIYNYFNKTK